MIQKNVVNIIQSIAMTDFAIKKINIGVIFIISIIFKWHVITILSTIFSFHPYIDFFTGIVITCGCNYYDNKFYTIINQFDVLFYNIISNIVKNYTPQLFLLYKRLLILSLNLYVCIILYLFPITSNELIICVIQSTIAFIITEMIEQNKFERLIVKVRDKQQRKWFGKVNIIDNFHPKEDEINIKKDENMEIIVLEDIINNNYFDS